MFAAKTKEVNPRSVNGIDVDALGEVIRDIERDPTKGIVEFRVTSQWQGADPEPRPGRLLQHRRPARGAVVRDRRRRAVRVAGREQRAQSQEMLMTALNACVMVGYVAGAAVKGIKLDRVEIETKGQLDLRGFLGIDETVRPGYETIHYVVRIKGDGTPAQFREIHETVMKTSPNYFNISKPIKIDAELRVE
jgi:uncharacterized OsmC-like protein